MIKRLIISNLIALTIGAIVFFAHSYSLKSMQIELNYSLFDVYVFFQLFFLVISSSVEIVNLLSRDNVGYYYLSTFVIKIMVFGVAYRGVLFSDIEMSTSARLSLILPLFIYIIFEAYYTIKFVISSRESHDSDLPE